ncbi:MAG: TrkA family potassium uptake protein [Lachnospiraceae bacterium]|nr:TrkA family potassium uptake protein [Lachnospiraceae bacterium]
MKSIMVIGLGRFGRSAARKLFQLGHEVMVVDNNENRVGEVLEYSTSALVGDSTNRGFLLTLGVSDYDLCIVSIGDNFESSLITTLHLKELGAKYVVSRASTDTHKKLLLHNGADEVVYPERQLAEWTAIRYSSDHIFDYIELDESCAIYEIDIPKGWVGKTVEELDIRRHHGLNIIGIRKDGRVEMEIKPDSILVGEERLFVAGNRKNIQKCFG